MSPAANQLDTQGHLKHFLTIEGLGRDLLTEILDKTEARQAETTGHVRYVLVISMIAAVVVLGVIRAGRT